jgi:tRNA threonylcarbamoyladenosine biosynthesis protein TsaB
VVVGLGPGSYTGLRVGLASAKALAYAVGCRFFGVETFAAIAMRAPAEVRDFSVIGDALQGKLFRRDYRQSDSGWEPAGQLGVISATDWLAGLRPGMWISGPATTAWEGKLPASVRAVPVDDREPLPMDLLTVARVASWAVTTDMWTAEPFYLRGSSAEEKAAGRA